jgi:glucokinase
LFLGNQLIASNANWKSNANASEISASGVAPTDDREASLQVNLEPGTYTAIVSSEDATSGIGLVEVYGVGSPLGY